MFFIKKQSLSPKLKIILLKLDKLRSNDRELLTFGASRYQFKLNKKASIRQVKAFEQKFSIELPAEYREFIINLGNGGAGPYYGLESLESSLFADLDHREENDLIDPSKEFKFSDFWNFNFADVAGDEIKYNELEDKYYENQWVEGLIRISNFGCGVFINLVVNGPEYGNIWVDDRCNDRGIYPYSYLKKQGRVTFFEWYELWLDDSIKKLGL